MAHTAIPLYSPTSDPMFQRPYIDRDEWQEDGRFRYVHGGFEGTDCLFAFFFPQPQVYSGRFFQYLAPVPGSENAALTDDGRWHIEFALNSGGYFVESNMGCPCGFVAPRDSTLFYRSSAAVAGYSRSLAMEMYGDAHSHGYLYGGSGGAYKVFSCIENTTVWDGAVPYVPGSPMALPNTVVCRLHAMRVLRGKLPQIADALEPGGNGDPYAALDAEEAAALREVTRMGLPLGVWRVHGLLDDGSLAVLVPGIKANDSGYCTDYWSLPGYEGTRPGSSAQRDRICYSTRIAALHLPGQRAVLSDGGGMNEAWQRNLMSTGEDKAWVALQKLPSEGVYLRGVELKVQSGAAKGLVLAVEKVEAGRAWLAPVFGAEGLKGLDGLARAKPGDRVTLDNCDYIALQTYHRHQMPLEPGYPVWDQFRGQDGAPLYPQHPLMGPGYAKSAGGSAPSGRPRCKTILLGAALDEAAFPWQADWYRVQADAWLGDRADETLRLWYVDNALHGDNEIPQDPLHLVCYRSVLCQALRDVSAWAEFGQPPPPSTGYEVRDGQLTLAPTATQRRGVQPVVSLLANGATDAQVVAGETVRLVANIQLPPGCGGITRVEWIFARETCFTETPLQNGGEDFQEIVLGHRYMQPGVYFPVVRAWAQRDGKRDDPFTQISNIARARVVVEPNPKHGNKGELNVESGRMH